MRVFAFFNKKSHIYEKVIERIANAECYDQHHGEGLQLSRPRQDVGSRDSDKY